jgi:hypothetical protein
LPNRILAGAMTALRRAEWHHAVAVVLPLTVLLLAGGSSSVLGVRELATHARWAGLFALGALALLQLAARGRGAVQLPAGWLLAGVFLALALESAAWSVDGGTSFAKACTVVLVFVTAAALALGAPTATVAATRTFDGILAGAAAVALASLLVLLVARDHAVLPATTGAGWRFQGIGENPNSVAMLLALALPIALWSAWARRGTVRLAAAGAFALFTGELAFSGSRGAVLAASGGLLVVVVACARPTRGKALGVAGVVAFAVACVLVAKLPSPASEETTASPAASSPARATRGIDAEQVFRLDGEIGFPAGGAYRPPVKRTIFGSSGRAQAWNGAIERGAKRPLAGYGFGTEDRAFVDRYYSFEGRFVENGYLGIFLQLGLVGLGAFLVLLAALALSAVGLLRSSARTGPAAAASGVLAAAMLVEMSQTGFLSVGNIAAATIWLSVLTLPALAREVRA